MKVKMTTTWAEKDIIRSFPFLSKSEATIIMKDLSKNFKQLIDERIYEHIKSLIIGINVASNK